MVYFSYTIILSLINFLQDIKDDVVYAVLGSLSSNQSQNLKTSILNFDESRVEYAKINYNITVSQNPVPVPSVEKPAKSDKGRFSSQANTFPDFHKIESTRNAGNDI